MLAATCSGLRENGGAFGTAQLTYTPFTVCNDSVPFPTWRPSITGTVSLGCAPPRGWWRQGDYLFTVCSEPLWAVLAPRHLIAGCLGYTQAM
jgi:hypothetical protein